MDELDDLLDPGIRSSGSSAKGEYQGKGALPNASAVLVLGILSLVGCFLYGLPGLICGVIALGLHTKDKRIYESNKSFYEDSFKNSRAGWICAIIGTSLSALYFLFAIILFASFFSHAPF